MQKGLSLLLITVLCVSVLLPVTAKASDIDDLQLYMGMKIEYVWEEPESEDIDGDITAGDVKPGSAGYIFTTKDTPELIAQALSNNHPSITAGFIRQLPMRDLLPVLTAIKSAADILRERGREDLLALGYLGGYIAPVHEYVSTDPEGSAESLVAAASGTPSWALKGDIGQIGERTATPVLGEIRLRSVYGETYVLGSVSFGRDEVVYDTPKGVSVYSVFNGYVAYVGSGVIEIRTYDQRLVVRYRGVEPADGCIVGKVYAQGESIGITSGFALGVGMKIDGIERNLLQVYTETVSKSWFDVWEKRNPGQTAKLVLNVGDSNYHMAAKQLDKNSPSSYTNPEMYGINPANIVSDKE